MKLRGARREGPFLGQPLAAAGRRHAKSLLQVVGGQRAGGAVQVLSVNARRGWPSYSGDNLLDRRDHRLGPILLDEVP
jgi:hypothetical protein